METISDKLDLDGSAAVVFWRDRLFWLAMLLGPAVWYLLLKLVGPVNDGAIPWVALFWIGLVYPIVEEFVFRGVLQPALYKYKTMATSIRGISLANVITSCLFAAMHLINQPPLWAAMVFFPSLVFGWARDRYGYLHASVVLHIFYNAGFIWFFAVA